MCILKPVFTSHILKHISHPHISLKIKWFPALVLVCILLCISAIKKRPHPVKLFITIASAAVMHVCLAWFDANLQLSLNVSVGLQVSMLTNKKMYFTDVLGCIKRDLSLM